MLTPYALQQGHADCPGAGQLRRDRFDSNSVNAVARGLWSLSRKSSRFSQFSAHNAIMRKWVPIAVVVLLVVAALGGIGWQVLRPQEHEPVYPGKRLSVWLRNPSGTHNNRLRQLTCALSVAGEDHQNANRDAISLHARRPTSSSQTC